MKNIKVFIGWRNYLGTVFIAIAGIGMSGAMRSGEITGIGITPTEFLTYGVFFFAGVGLWIWAIFHGVKMLRSEGISRK